MQILANSNVSKLFICHDIDNKAACSPHCSRLLLLQRADNVGQESQEQKDSQANEGVDKGRGRGHLLHHLLLHLLRVVGADLFLDVIHLQLLYQGGDLGGPLQEN